MLAALYLHGNSTLHMHTAPVLAALHGNPTLRLHTELCKQMPTLPNSLGADKQYYPLNKAAAASSGSMVTRGPNVTMANPSPRRATVQILAQKTTQPNAALKPQATAIPSLLSSTVWSVPAATCV